MPQPTMPQLDFIPEVAQITPRPPPKHPQALCPIFDAEYCANFRKSYHFGTADVRACLDTCLREDGCTGGYFFGTTKTCYMFGTVSAEDQFCGPVVVHASSTSQRFDCSQLASKAVSVIDIPAVGQTMPQPPATLHHFPFDHRTTDVVPGVDQTMCVGVTEVIGHGEVHIVRAKKNLPQDEEGDVRMLAGGVVAPSMKGRAYFAAGQCFGNDYSTVTYSSIPLLGRTFRYNIDLSGVECGCNAALYLTMMHENKDEGECGDRYCDANHICGISCDEIDIQEANKHAWYSTLHTWDDGNGVGGGYGAYRHEWNASVYGPGAKCIDTNIPFEVRISFPVLQSGLLKSMDVMLTQVGKPCPLTSSTRHYKFGQKDGMGELTESLRRGVTPVISYWGLGEDMSWMDGSGSGTGPACVERPETCGEIAKFWGFVVED